MVPVVSLERQLGSSTGVGATAAGGSLPQVADWMKWIVSPAMQIDPRVEMRLLCFPFAGSAGAEFREWAPAVPPEIDVCAIQLPGRGARWNEVPVSNMATLVARMAADLQPLLSIPFALLGHSMGAILAFELARHLRRTGSHQPVHVFASGARAPHLPDPEPPASGLPDADFLARLKTLNGFPAELRDNDEFLRLVLPTLRADVLMCDTYRVTADAPLDCPLTALGGLDDTRVPRAHVAAWAGYTQNRFRLRFFAGDHFFITNSRAQVVSAVLAELTRPVAARRPS